MAGHIVVRPTGHTPQSKWYSRLIVKIPDLKFPMCSLRYDVEYANLAIGLITSTHWGLHSLYEHQTLVGEHTAISAFPLIHVIMNLR